MTVLQAVDYHAIGALLALGVALVAVLVADLFLPAGRKHLVAAISLAGIAAALGITLSLAGTHQPGTFCLPAGALADNAGGTAVPRSCSYVVDGFAVLLQSTVLVAVALVVLMGLRSTREDRLPQGELHLLLLASTIGMVSLVASRDLLALLVSLEVLALPSFVLAGLRRHDARSTEAALKYFLVSVVATAVSLLGMSLLYGVTGTLQFDRLALQLAHPPVDGPIASVAVGLTLVAFVFKVSAVPFHTWAPDTYQGAPLPVAAFLSVASKTAGFGALLALCLGALRPAAGVWGPLVAVLAALTMTVGNLVALRQRHAVRLLAWSSIAQAGYVLVPLAVAASARSQAGDLHQALAASLTYLVIYAGMQVGAFAAVQSVLRDHRRNEIEDHRGLARRAPLLALALGFLLLNLAGAPPGLGGLWAKVVVFQAAVDGHLGWLAIVMAVNTVIGLAYYLRWTALLFAEGPGDRLAAPPWSERVALALPVLGVAAVGVVPSLVLHLTPLATLAVR